MDDLDHYFIALAKFIRTGDIASAETELDIIAAEATESVELTEAIAKGRAQGDRILRERVARVELKAA